MSSPGMRGQGAGPQQLDALPLRSLAAVWVFVSVCGLALLAFVLRGAWSSPERERSARATGAAKGPTKLEIKQRQEHIALTQRALELAQKERKAKAEAGPAAPAAATGPAPAAPAAPAPGEPPASSGAKLQPEKAATAPETGKQPGVAPAAETAPAPSAPASKPSGGLDAMRSDIAVDFE